MWTPLKKTLKELAELVKGAIKGDPSVEIEGVAPIESAGKRDIAYIRSRRYLSMLEKSEASAMIVPFDVASDQKNLLCVENPQLAFAKVLALFHPRSYKPTGVDTRSCISASAKLGKDVSIGPFVCIGDQVRVGDRVVIGSGVFVGANTTIGDDCFIHANVSIYEGTSIGNRAILHSGVVVGSDGFGYVRDGDAHFKIPQVGGVTIEDDVEIGANSTVDRATLGQTVIKRGVKIDNLVQVAHNVTIGENSILVAQVGIAGSSRVGRNVVLAGQVGVADHVEIGDNVMVGAQSGVSQDIPPNEFRIGTPAIPHREFLKAVLLFPKLPEIKRILEELQRRLKKLEEKNG